MNKNYNLKLDLQFKCNNSKMIFDEFDENTSDFFMQITRQGEKVDISNSIPTLLVLKPSGVAQSQILEVKNNIIYGNLKNSLKNEVGTYIAKLMLAEGDKKIFISNISYEVTENALLGKVDNDIVEDERYSVLLQLLERVSNIELQEQTRIDNENSRIEAENLRQEAIEKVKNDIANLINETNKKVNDNLNSNTSKIDNLIIDTKEELNEYKSNKDISIDEDLKEFKENTSKSIENYKTSKDIEITNSLNTYKADTTNDINNFKNTVNSKIDKYKNDKDKAINEYVEAKSSELDNYMKAKNNEIDLYISEKNTLIDSKMYEVDTTKEQLQNSVNNKLVEVDNAEKQRQEEHEERQQFLDGFEGKLNTVVDDVAGIKDDVVSVREANKRQDVFLQGLYNENLDGRVTVREEGSVISLTNSADGLVDIVGLQGNTLVNYCVDGAKELTLNGDIDAEGTNITLTEGVDNGLVDVMCEGNTLVNLNKYISKEKECVIYAKGWYNQLSICELSQIKVNTDYTLIYDLEIIENNTTWELGTNTKMTIGYGDVFNAVTGHPSINYMNNSEGVSTNTHTIPSKSNNKIIFNISDYKTTILGKYFAIRPITCSQLLENQSIKYKVKNLILLEGDYTNKPIPTEYIEGMKSVAECEDNKIEILSNNQNLYSENEFLSPLLPKEIINNKEYYVLKGNNIITANNLLVDDTMFKFKENTRYTFIIKGMRLDYFHIFYVTYTDGTRSGIRYNDIEETEMTFTTLENKTIKNVFTDTGSTDAKSYILVNGICMKEGTDSTFVPRKLNKKEITLSEPLRALPNGVKDKIVKIGGKHYIERNCKAKTLNGTETGWYIWQDQDNTISFAIPRRHFDEKLSGSADRHNTLCDLFVEATQITDSEWYMTHSASTTAWWAINILKTKLTTVDVAGFKQWLQQNPTTIVYLLETPIYEEITDPAINTYNDITHISNNSTIPCNMEIQNSGYNAIIKPSTQYTVAFDTDRGGEVGINLAGSKVTTNNNVATVTTPSTLTDDSLRLYGKGIKASKVRLFEGDKTNWIPSYFEGMKSCFEDKLQDDGTYKIEITSANTDNTLSNKIQFSSIEPLRGIGDVKDRFLFKDGKLMIERNCGEVVVNGDYAKDTPVIGNTSNIIYIDIPNILGSVSENVPNAICNNRVWLMGSGINWGSSPHNTFVVRPRLTSKSVWFIVPADIITLEMAKEYLNNNPTTLVYQLKEPIYEEIPFELQKIILEGYINGTLFFDTNIPPTVTASYTANVPLVSKVNEVNDVTETNTEDIAITQMAVDFLLMSTLGEEMLNFKLRSGYNMASYFASRIIKGALKYEDVINKYTQYKEDINSILISEGHSDLIVEL